MKRLPIIPTLVVGLAVAIMIGLGFWQLARKGEKEAQIALLEANLDKPAVTYPELAPVPDDMLFRPSTVTCLSVENWKTLAGIAKDGTSGFRYIAHCRTGAEGPGAWIVAGVGQRPNAKLDWDGGTVAGTIGQMPTDAGFIARISGSAPPQQPMLVASKGLAGLKASQRPSPDTIPNNHLAYAGQWFAFALTALIIYALALRRRRRERSRD